MARLKIAVVGAGIGGMAAAWLLGRADGRHDVTLFDAEPRAGGHANTVDVATPDGRCPIDTGFIVYNTACYPNLIALFAHLDVPTAPTAMTFAVSLAGGGYEYSGSGIRGLFGQPANALRVGHWRMCLDILRFFRAAEAMTAAAADERLSLGAWLEQRRYSRDFIDRHILPMGAAIWSAPAEEILAYPAAAFARFFANHGLLQVRNRPQWRTVAGGSQVYVEKLLADYRGEVRCGAEVVRVARAPGGATLSFADGQQAQFDHVVLATHADQALALLADADADERRRLAPFRYAMNEAVLHTDARLMPRRRRLWSSWNFIGGGAASPPCVSYWMNALQPLATATDYFVTLNPPMPVAPTQVVARFNYTHPIFDSAAISAQRHLWQLQGRRRTWFCGSYFGAGFHEDGLQAGLAVAEALGGVRRPWTVADESGRIHLGVPLRADIAEAVA